MNSGAGAAGSAEQQEAMKQQVASSLASGITYECGDCAAKVQLRPRDPILCQSCGYRILYKVRTARLQQYEAR
ncbi:DNA-directed RNA polymerases I, II, and III subunit RPABC4 [Hondaea fermentalgiana]|uniref:DNA-directed RNA polymerases I, II, and III subunit RPABC4 n=1 Tax=Hondaea fermentalgiana TaxID=2315210 RepID=A0A2R5GB54_9STRA|nr:DNA-directed RNA polymerases I, II, and III subunit RPABC4 [Hondaea fermentalgiana]|eukprot:GBG24934.1 DNA-directed RNA polymerases I, II, and III subunit RPABC4 [Hondaea fermentalgiana]